MYDLNELITQHHLSFSLSCKYWSVSWPAGHVPLQGRVLGAPLTLRWHTSFDPLLLWLELLPLCRSNVDGLEVDLILTVLHLWTRVTQDAKVRCTSRGKRGKRPFGWVALPIMKCANNSTKPRLGLDLALWQSASGPQHIARGSSQVKQAGV